MQNFFIVVHSGYKATTVAIFPLQQKKPLAIDQKSLNNQQASKLLIPTIKELLDNNACTLHTCQFLAACQGPAPFTSLRTGLTTINGLAYAATIPTVGLDGLKIFAHEVAKKTKSSYVLILLNAFCNDVYYALHNKKTHQTTTGWGPAHDVIISMTQDIQNSSDITISGNAVELHKDLIENNFCDYKLDFYDQAECSLNELAQQAQYQWNMQKNITSQIMPLYLKPSSAKLAQQKK